MSKYKEWVANCYLLILFSVFPLFVRNYYYDLQEAKSLFFIVITYTTACVWFLIWMITVVKARHIRQIRDIQDKQNIRNILPLSEVKAGQVLDNKNFVPLSEIKAGQVPDNKNFVSLSEVKVRQVPDNKSFLRWKHAPIIFLLLFFLCSCVSASMTRDPMAALTGSDGRGMGILWLAACVLAFLITRNIRVLYESGILFTIAVSAAIVILIGLLHATGINFGGFLDHVPSDYRGNYLTTLGYINYVSQYASFIVIILAAAYCRKGSKWLLPFCTIGFMGLILGNSDAGFLGVALSLSLFPVLLIRERREAVRFFEALATFPLACGLMAMVSTYYQGNQVLDKTVVLLLKPVCFLFLAALSILLRFCFERKIHEEKLVSIRKLYFRIMILLLAVIVSIFALANVGILNLPALQLTDQFATNRCYIWRKVLELYRIYPIRQKLFGCGPDALLPEMISHFGPDMVEHTGQIFDSAHNDFLHYMVTIGMPGAICYAGFLLSTIIIAIKNRNSANRVWLLAFAAFVIQGFFVPSQPVTTPYAFAFAGLALADYKIRVFELGE